MKFSLVGSFNLADGYLGAAKALEKQGHVVSFVPAMLYRSEYPENHEMKILEDLIAQCPDVVLWWRAETLTVSQLGYIKAKVQGKHIMYSWDDPHQWHSHPEMPYKSRLLDIAFSCCYSSLSLYEKNHCKAIYCPPGYDPEIHFPEYSEEHVCDVSLVCTNLYHGISLTTYPHLSRKKLLQKLEGHDIDLRLYGSQSFENEFPKIYKGWISFDISRKVFNSSKINICTHIRPDGYKYINERVTQILGSGGLLFVDHVNGIEDVLPEKSFVIIDPKYIADQVKEILSNYEKYKQYVKTGYEFASSNLTWNNWANIILNGLKELEK